MDIQTIQPEIKKYLKNVNRHITVSDALVFGSVAEGRATETSDVDLLVLSEDFAKLDTDERAKLLYRASVGFPYDLHVFGLTPQEFHSASPLTSLGKILQSKTVHIS